MCKLQVVTGQPALRLLQLRHFPQSNSPAVLLHCHLGAVNPSNYRRNRSKNLICRARPRKNHTARGHDSGMWTHRSSALPQKTRQSISLSHLPHLLRHHSAFSRRFHPRGQSGHLKLIRSAFPPQHFFEESQTV